MRSVIGRILVATKEHLALTTAERNGNSIRAQGEPVSAALLAHTSPLTWEHIGFSGDFLWDRAATAAGRRRPLNLGRLKTAA